jgi:hypothetical protein
METKYPAKRLSEPSKQLASRKIRTMDMIVESLLLGLCLVDIRLLDTWYRDMRMMRFGFLIMLKGKMQESCK